MKLETRNSPHGFTLIELLVVVAIIALLIAVLMPSLKAARREARLAACASNLHHLMVGVHAYAAAQGGRIPAGPDIPFPFDPTRSWTQFATGWIWIGPLRQYSAHGLLCKRGLPDLRIAFCPDDREMNVDQQLGAIGSPIDAYGTYGYRHLDQTTRDRIENLGCNSAGRRARALFFDMISEGPIPVMQRTTHERRFVNVAYVDSHVSRLRNTSDVFSFFPADFANPAVTFARRLDQVLVTADHAETSDPLSAPHLP